MKTVVIASNNFTWADVVKRLLTLSYPELSYAVTHNVDVDNKDFFTTAKIVIYDRESLGCPLYRWFKPKHYTSKWLVVNSSASDAERVIGYIASGYSGLIAKDCSIELLPKAVRAVAAGELWFSRHAMCSAIHDLLRDDQSVEDCIHVLGAKYELTMREQQVCHCIFQGFVNKDIAAHLNLSLSTIKCHVSSILMKTGKKNRAQLISLSVGNDSDQE